MKETSVGIRRRILYPETFAKNIKNWWETKQLPSQLKEAARHLAEGKPGLFPGQGVYVILLDGRKLEVVERVRLAKGRRPDQREATVVPPEKLFELVDFSLLLKLNPLITSEVIRKLYLAHPVGLVLPCKKETVPDHLITHHQVNGKEVPTIMNIWLSRYRIFEILWQEVSRYPEVLLAGSSANRTNQPSPTSFQEARREFSSHVTIAIKDPHEKEHFYRGSHTVLSLINNPPRVIREGSVHPELHPGEFQKFKDILPDLVV